MSPTKAIKIARGRVRMISYGVNDYVVQTWSPRHNATWESHHMDRYRAMDYVKEERIREALEQVGVEDAGAEANSLAFNREGRWDAIVRDFLRRRVSA